MSNNELLLDKVFEVIDLTPEEIKKFTDSDKEKISEVLIFMNMLYNDKRFFELRSDLRLMFYQYVKEYYLANFVKLEVKDQ